MSKIKTSISLSPETHAVLTAQAAEEQRTVSNMVERVIEKVFGKSRGQTKTRRLAGATK